MTENVETPTAATARRNERGATAVEYALLSSLIAAVIGVSVGMLGARVEAFFEMGLKPFP